MGLGRCVFSVPFPSIHSRLRSPTPVSLPLSNLSHFHNPLSNAHCLANPRRSAQALIGQLLTKQWGLDSYIRWLHGLQAQYTARRDTLVDSLLDGFEFSLAYADGAGYLNGLPVYSCFPKGRRGIEKQVGRVLSFAAPTSGMFVWVRLTSSLFPLPLPLVVVLMLRNS